MSTRGVHVSAILAVLLISGPTALAACVQAPSGLVAWLRMEGSGLEAVSGSVRETQGDVQFAAGKIAQAAQFGSAGNPGRVEIDVRPELNSTNFTIQTWIRRSDANVVTLNPGGVNAAIYTGDSNPYTFGIMNDGTLFYYQPNAPFVVSTGAIKDLNWHHVAVRREGTQLRFYIDGAVAGSTTYSAALDFRFNIRYYIGANPSANQSLFGFLDELMVFNRALTEAEIQSLAAAVDGLCINDVSVGAEVKDYRVTQGDEVVYPVTLANVGTTTISDIVVEASFASGFANVSVDSVKGSTEPGYRIRFASLGSGETATIFLRGAATAIGVFTNEVKIVSPVSDFSSANNAMRSVFTVLRPFARTPEGLVAWWPGSNTPNGGEIFGRYTDGFPGFVAGKVGEAFHFSGGGNSLFVGGGADFNLPVFSVEAFIRRESDTVVTRTPSLNGCGRICGMIDGWNVGLWEDGALSLMNGFTLIAKSSAPIVDTNWHHIAITKAGATVRFYVDGVAAGEATYEGTFTPDTQFRISGLPAQMNGYNGFLGDIDELAVYNRAISGDAIAAIVEAAPASKTSTDIRLWTTTALVRPAAGSATPLSLSVLNYGEPRATNTVVSFDIPEGVVITGLAPTVGIAEQAGSQIIWNAGAIGVGPAQRLDFKAAFPGPGQYFLSAAVVSAGQDIRPSNNTAVIRADLFRANCTTAPPGLIAFYSADHGLDDVLGFGTATNPSGVQRMAGFKGQAFQFTGPQQGLLLPTPELPELASFAIEAWVQRETAGGFFFGSNGGGVRAGVAETGEIFLDADLANRLTASSLISDNLWHHVLFAGAAGRLQFFVDGLSAGEAALPTGLVLRPPYSIGSSQAGSTTLKVDEFSIYDQPVSAVDAFGLFLAGPNGKCPEDISTSATTSLAVLPVGETNIVSFVVTNRGNFAATGVTLKNFFPDTIKVAALLDDTSLVASDESSYEFDLGTLEPGGQRQIIYRVYSTAPGDQVIRAVAGRTEDDLALTNNFASAKFNTPPLTVSLGEDISIYEPDTDPMIASFGLTLNLASAMDRAVYVHFNDLTARAGKDYSVITNKVVFPAGSTSRIINVMALGDFIYEGTETFQIELDSTNELARGRSVATATINDNDAAPYLRLSGATVDEGNAGTNYARFTVGLFGRYEHPIEVSYFTTNATAALDQDYHSANGVIIFQPNEHEKIIDIAVLGDAQVERNESFGLNVRGVGIGSRQSVGTILNDDGIGGEPAAFVWGAISNGVAADSPIPAEVSAINKDGSIDETFNGAVLLNAVRGYRQSPLVITEIDSGVRDSVEIQNVSAGPINLSGWRLYLYDATRWPAPVAVFEFPNETSLAARALTVIAEGNTPRAGGYPLGTLLSWMDSQTGSQYSPTAALLEDPAGNVRDLAVANGASPGEIRDPHPIAAGEWQGPLLELSSGRPVMQRMGIENHRSSIDWTNVFAANLGTANPLIATPFVDSAFIGVLPDASGAFNAGRWSGAVTLRTPAAPISLAATDTRGRTFFSSSFTPTVSIDLEANVDIDPPVLVYGAIGTKLILTVANNGQSAITNVIGELAFPLSFGTYGATASQGTTDTIASATEVRRRARFGTILSKGTATLTIDIARLPASGPTALSPVTIRGSVTNVTGEANLANNSQTVVTEISRAYASRPPGLKAWWPAELNSLDALGTNRLLAAPSVSYEEGRIGFAFRTVGDSAPLTLPPEGMFNIPASENFGIEFWFKVIAQPEDGVIDLAQKMMTDPTESQIGWRIRLVDGQPSVYYCDALSQSSFNNVSGSFVNVIDGQWHHFSFDAKRTGSSHDATLRLDGSVWGMFGRSVEGGSISNSAPLIIGRGLTGLIDEIGFYRSTNDISPAFIYSLGSHGKIPGGVDSDQDGIPDAWQYAVENEFLAGWFDKDSDGAFNWQEIAVGTAPTDSTSVFALRGRVLADGRLEFRFPIAANRTYTVEKSLTADGSSGWTKVAGGIIAFSQTEHVLTVQATEGYFRAFAQ
jgi:hypothetical protein